MAIYSWDSLHTEKDAGELIRSHDSVIEYWEDHNDKRYRLHEHRKGRPWSARELKLFHVKNKTPVVFHKSISAIRTIMGTFIQNRYDIKPAPFEPTDQPISDIISQRYHWTAHNQKVRYKDPILIQEALVGGNAIQESYIQITPGNKPRLIVSNQNPAAIYWDPKSRDLIDRYDCDFVDRDTWASIGDLMERFPEKEDLIKSELDHLEERSYFETSKRSEEMRDHEYKTERNGLVRVTERFYKVRKLIWKGVSPDYKDEVLIGFDEDGERRKEFQEEYPEHELHADAKEFLFLAVVCDSLSLTEFLFNGAYHCQPRDPVTEKIMFPFTELICEQLDGETNGFLEYLQDPDKIINSMISNKLHAAKHAANTSMVADPSNFTEEDLEDITKHHADGDRMFKVKPGKDPSKAVSLLPQGRAAPDTDGTLNFANMFHEEISSAPPAAKGMAEGNVPGVLNEQRIQQAFMQLTGFVEYYKLFLTNRAKLWHYYDMEYVTAEETFRIIEKDKPTEENFQTLNQVYIDDFGDIKKANDIGAAAYDIVFEDSWQSPTVRDKVRQQIIQLQQSTGVQNDPVLNTYLTLYFLKLTDAPQDLKDFVKEHSSVVKQVEAQKQAQESQQTELDAMEQMQNMAQTGDVSGQPVQTMAQSQPGTA